VKLKLSFMRPSSYYSRDRRQVGGAKAFDRPILDLVAPTGSSSDPLFSLVMVIVVEAPVRLDHVRRLLPDHDGGGVGVA